MKGIQPPHARIGAGGSFGFMIHTLVHTNREANVVPYPEVVLVGHVLGFHASLRAHKCCGNVPDRLDSSKNLQAPFEGMPEACRKNLLGKTLVIVCFTIALSLEPTQGKQFLIGRAQIVLSAWASGSDRKPPRMAPLSTSKWSKWVPTSFGNLQKPAPRRGELRGA